MTHKYVTLTSSDDRGVWIAQQIKLSLPTRNDWDSSPVASLSADFLAHQVRVKGLSLFASHLICLSASWLRRQRLLHSEYESKSAY